MTSFANEGISIVIPLQEDRYSCSVSNSIDSETYGYKEEYYQVMEGHKCVYNCYQIDVNDSGVDQVSGYIKPSQRDQVVVFAVYHS